MKKTGKAQKARKPDYVTALEAVYGAPSQAGFGSAVFFETKSEEQDLEALAKAYYQHFVGDKWDEWGPEAWLSAWRETYRRPKGAAHDVVQELYGVPGTEFHMQVDMILEVVEHADKARAALADAFDPVEIEDLRAYLIGDGEAMSGMLLAGRRRGGDATILVFLMD